MDAPDAFRQQLLAALPRLRRYMRALVLDAAGADALVHTVLERALAHWHQFDQRRDLLLWVLCIAHNAHQDLCRRDARLSTLNPPPRPRALDQPAGTLGPIGLRLDLAAALRALPPELREPLLLVSVEQLSHAEVAEVLQLAPDVASARIGRARTALRRLLEDDAGSASARAHLRRVV